MMGEWCTIPENENATLYQQGMINAARLEGYAKSKFITLSHGFQAMKKSLNAEAEDTFKDDFFSKSYSSISSSKSVFG